jgi:cytochrome c biogenesis protein CcdA
MNEWTLAIGGAFWFGILTSISPCLMATNVTAITFIARKIEHPRYVALSAAFYILGQSIAFILLAMVLVSSLLTVPVVSHWLQKYMFRLLGPILILAAMFLLELLDIQLGNDRMKQWAQGHAEQGGLGVAALLGIVFAMSFCPTTAALFFGSLLPLAVTHESSFILPLSYSLGVALPVILFALLITLATNRVSQFFEKIGQLERWARSGTGTIFLLVGIWFTLAYTLKLF